MRTALAENRMLRFAVVTVLYVAQGFPIGLFDIALPAWLLQQGLAAAEVATLSAVAGLPWAFKVVVAPLMDRYGYLPMGRRRPWILGAQLGAVACAAGLMFVPGPDTGIAMLVALAFAVNSFAATQDVAVDGMVMDILPADERGRANAFMMGGQVAGLSISGALAGALLPIGGIPLAGGAMCVMLALVTATVLVTRERGGERLLPWTVGAATPRPDLPPQPAFSTLLRDLFVAFVAPISLLLVATELLMRTAGGMGIVFYPQIAVQRLGAGADEYAYLTSITGAAAAAAGVLAGVYVDRAGALRVLAVLLWVLAGCYLAGALLEPWWDNRAVPIAVFVTIQFVVQFVMVAMIASFMNTCTPAIAATQFAIYMMLANLARSGGAALYGRIGDALSEAGALQVMATLTAMSAVVAWQVATRHARAAPVAA